MPLGSQALNLKLDCYIGIVSHHPVPLTMKAANFRSEHGGGWAFLWRNLGGIDQDFRARLRIEKNTVIESDQSPRRLCRSRADTLVRAQIDRPSGVAVHRKSDSCRNRPTRPYIRGRGDQPGADRQHDDYDRSAKSDDQPHHTAGRRERPHWQDCSIRPARDRREPNKKIIEACAYDPHSS